jgi:hypothetical protein
VVIGTNCTDSCTLPYDHDYDDPCRVGRDECIKRLICLPIITCFFCFVFGNIVIKFDHPGNNGIHDFLLIQG